MGCILGLLHGEETCEVDVMFAEIPVEFKHVLPRPVRRVVVGQLGAAVDFLTRYGVAAAEACLRGEYNVMVSLYHDQIVTVYIQRAASQPRQVPVDSEIIRTGRQIGICFGD